MATLPLMLLPPVLERELRVAFHRHDARKSRSRVARFGVLGVSLFLLLGGVTGSVSWGSTLHLWMFLAGLNLAAAPALRISVGLFAEERRQQTLDLLYLTGMGSGELFIGKLLGGVLVSSSELLALAPLVAIPFLSGGLDFDLFLATAICLPTIFTLVLAIGSLASALCQREDAALVLSTVLLGVACVAVPLPYNLGFWLSGNVPFDKGWLISSPALGPWMVLNRFSGFKVGDFWVWTVLMWVCSALCLATAALVLKRNWRRDIARTGAVGLKPKWQAFFARNVRAQETLRRRILLSNAYQWLAQRDGRPAFLAWMSLSMAPVFWLIGWCAWPQSWLSPFNLYTTAILLLLGIDGLVSYAAARQMATDRRDGALELLLTTALSPEDMLAGQKAALQDQFGLVKRALLFLLLLMVIAGMATRGWTREGLVSYFVIWSVLLAWWARSTRRHAPRAMWIAANCGRPLYAALKSRGPRNRTVLIYSLFLMINGLGPLTRVALSFPNGSAVEMWFTMAIVFWAFLLMVGLDRSSAAVAKPLVTQLRLIAQEPLPHHNDPRFKEWKDLHTRFPEPPGGRLGFPGEDPSPPKPINAAGAWLWRPLGRACGLAWGKLLKAARKR